MSSEKKEPTKHKRKPSYIDDAESEKIMLLRQREIVEGRIEGMSHRLFKNGERIGDGVIFEEEEALNKPIGKS